MPETVSGWIRTNLGLAAALFALGGTIIGGVVAGTAWLASVHHLEVRVNVLRGDVNGIRAMMDDNRETVAGIRRQLDASDAAIKESIARLDERLKAEERGP